MYIWHNANTTDETIIPVIGLYLFKSPSKIIPLKTISSKIGAIITSKINI